MSTSEVRSSIDNLLDVVQDKNEAFLKVVHSMLATYANELEDPVIGYEINGQPVLASEAKTQFAEDLSKRDELMSVEDFDKELDRLF